MNKLYGRRILHVMSPVRWAANKWLHQADSNWKVLYKTIKFLPDCHHFVLIPTNNEMDIVQDNITFIKFPYPSSVLANRGFFNYKALKNYFNWRKHDVDFIFLHQPELFYNVMSGILSERYGTSVNTFVFFHWIDSPKSKPSETYTDGFWRQIEAIDLSSKTFFHCDATLTYLKQNWNKIRITGKIIDSIIKEKITYMPLATETFDKSQPFDIDMITNKKILVFNHRWNNSTGIKRLIEYTNDLNRDKWVVWITDNTARKPKSGQSAPKWMIVKSLPNKAQYQYLIEKAYATLSFVDAYATWNLSVQDGLSLGIPSLIFEHPIMESIIGNNYPFYFKKKEEFLEVLEKVSSTFDWTLPLHEKVFKTNLLNSMNNAIEMYETARKYEPHSLDGKRLYGREWLWHIINGNGYKRNILYNTHKDLHLSNSWEHLRRWVLMIGARDNPFSEETYLTIPEENKEKIKKLLDDSEWEDRSYANECKTDQSFIRSKSSYKELNDRFYL